MGSGQAFTQPKFKELLTHSRTTYVRTHAWPYTCTVTSNPCPVGITRLIQGLAGHLTAHFASFKPQNLAIALSYAVKKRCSTYFKMENVRSCCCAYTFRPVWPDISPEPQHMSIGHFLCCSEIRSADLKALKSRKVRSGHGWLTNNHHDPMNIIIF